jgi:succinate dehydrogenase / fumarate reductase flavoprotein subunit
MQGLADGYFVIPYTLGEYLADDILTGKISTDSPEFEQAEQEVNERLNRFVNQKGTNTVDYYHKKLGKIMWNNCGMSRNAENLKQAIADIKNLREEFWNNVKVPGTVTDFNPELEKAGRVADFLELGELMCRDALDRNESCGGHFREEYQTPDGEALRDDVNCAFVSVWEYKGDNQEPVMHKEALEFENVKPSQRSYK